MHRPLAIVLLASASLATSTPHVQACDNALQLLAPVFTSEVAGPVVFQLACDPQLPCPAMSELRIQRDYDRTEAPGSFAMTALEGTGASLVTFTPQSPLMEARASTYSVFNGAGGTIARFGIVPGSSVSDPLRSIAGTLGDRVREEGPRYRCPVDQAINGCNSQAVGAKHREWAPRGVRVPTLAVRVGPADGWLFAAYAASTARPEGLVFGPQAQLSVDLREGEPGCVTLEAVHARTAERATRSVCETGRTYSESERDVVLAPNLGACLTLPRDVATNEEVTQLLEPWCSQRHDYCPSVRGTPSECSWTDPRCAPSISPDSSSTDDADETARDDRESAATPTADQLTDHEAEARSDVGCSLGARNDGAAWLLALLLGWLATRSRVQRAAKSHSA